MLRLGTKSMTGSATAPAGPRWYIPQLDGIRAIAIIMVFWRHLTLHYGWPLGVEEVGASGVMLFFVLSGYLITRILLVEETNKGSINFPRFAMRRVRRLMPALWMFLTVLVGLKLAGLIDDQPWRGIVSSFFYVRNIIGQGHETAHLWSLSLEEQFYVLWPLALFFVKRFNLRCLILCVVVVGCPIWRQIADTMHLTANPGITYFRTDFRMDAPALGCLLALLEIRFISRGGVFLLNKSLRFGLLVVGGGLLAGWCYWRATGTLGGLNYTISGLCSLLIVASQCGRPNTGQSWVLGTVPMVIVGKLSYSLYLWHQLFLGPHDTLSALRSNAFVAVALSVLAATLSYLLLELPYLRSRHRGLVEVKRDGQAV